MNRLLVLGRNGQVGGALTRLLGLESLSFGRDRADLTDPAGLKALIHELRPDAVINAAAFTAVDLAETEEARAFTINADAPHILAEVTGELGIPLVHYSTDYVFDGEGAAPRREDAPTAPLNAYGRSKRAGEEAVIAAGGQHLIFRTSWVYDADGKNFFNTMLRLGAERETLSVVADQIGAPTYALHLADRTLTALRRAMGMPEFPSGVYHLCGGGETSWHGFATRIFHEAKEAGLPVIVSDLKAIASKDYPTPAKRPLNSRLACAKAEQVLGVTMPKWEIGLAEAIAQKVKQVVREDAD